MTKSSRSTRKTLDRITKLAAGLRVYDDESDFDAEIGKIEAAAFAGLDLLTSADCAHQTAVRDQAFHRLLYAFGCSGIGDNP